MLHLSRPLRALATWLLTAQSIFATDFLINSDDELSDLFQNNSVQPGDAIIWEDGVYTDQRIYVLASGEAGNPVTLRAETPGGAQFRGDSQIKFGGNYIEVSGLLFYNGDNYDREVGSSIA
jgi:hypothetical protein|tara:strand:+ start:2724 stop:3086 length:363 start_codon:yes stop_codon:yes gene_type:complete